MNKDKAMLWVRALRSGEFKQGTSMLYNAKDNTYCVNGLLCMLAMLDGACDYAEKALFGAFDSKLRSVPVDVKNWAEMKTGALPGEFVTLSWMNDEGYTFEELATLIQENYEQI